MKLASHDTMTYLKPKRWWLTPFHFMARCQSKTIEEQYEKYGIRYFDLRISFNKEGYPEFRHGSMVFKGADVFKVLEYLNNKNEGIQIRILLEGNEATFKFKYLFNKDKIEKEKQRQIKLFQIFMLLCESTFTDLKFHCGRSKWDWKVIYECKNPEPTLDQKISSMTWKIFDDWYPYIYARLMNHKNIKMGTDKDYLMIDFLHIQ